MRILRLFLLPLSFLYCVIVFIRNKFYDFGWFKSQRFDMPIISVGNLEVGGSGKTPMVEYLIHNLKENHLVATLSRGYGRKTKGFLWVNPDDLASKTGDEPLQLKQKFPSIGVAVCENRVIGIEKIKKKFDLILMDDAYQHRAVQPSLSILLFDYHHLTKPKFLLPAGNYREAFSGRKRADVLVVSKSPKDLTVNQQEQIISILKPYPYQKVFFSSINYEDKLKGVLKPTQISVNELTPVTTVLLLTGIANPTPLLQELKKHTQNILHHAYADHHPFTQKNMLKLVKDFEQISAANKIIITTQKDAVRLRSLEFERILTDLPIFEWPITVNFLGNTHLEFDQFIQTYVRQYQRSSRIY